MVGYVRSLFPHQTDFFLLFEQNAQTAVEAGQVLVEALEHPASLAEQVSRMKELEHAADEVTHQVMVELHRTFVTPIDRDEIGALAHALDDVVDAMEEALTRMLLFKLYAPSALAQELAQVALQQAEVIHRGMPLMRDQHRRSDIQDDLIEIHRLENAADRSLEQALSTLYDDPPDLAALIERVKWREVYELLEMATDRAEDVAKVLEEIVSKNA
jgi:predicted phosphate transport protein (TIGR00153 family)